MMSTPAGRWLMNLQGQPKTTRRAAVLAILVAETEAQAAEVGVIATIPWRPEKTLP